ncbi:MAG: hypothetical protein CL609_11055 [Anaerolineaceae bacterium]|nr:hypothetical protein [Anaerolineaceae bacterium]
MNLNQISEILENPHLLDHLKPSENVSLKINGLFYVLEYEIPEEDSLEFARKYLTDNPTSRYKDYFINFLFHKNSSGNIDANQIAFDFLFSNPDPELLNRFVNYNIKPVSQEHVTLFFLYQNNRTSFLESESHLEILTTYFLESNSDLQAFLIQKAETNQLTNWVIVAKTVLFDSAQHYKNLLDNFEKFSSDEKRLTAHILAKFIQTQPGVIDLLFELYNTYQNDNIFDVITTNQLIPTNPENYTLFLLFTDQQDLLESFDFDNAYLKSAFLKATPNQRQKILAQSRKSGKFNWLQEISSDRHTKWASDLSENDWESILARLVTEKNEKNLLRLLKIVPAIQAIKIILTIHQLSEKTFEFTKDEDWLALINSVNQLPEKLPQPLEINSSNTLANPVLSSQINSKTNEILLGTPSNLIQKIKLDTLKIILPAFDSPAPQIRQMLLSQDQKYMILAHGDHTIRVLRLHDKQVIKTFSGHTGYIKKLLLTDDQRTLYSTGFDGKLIAWRFPLGPILQTRQISNQECFDMAFSAGQKSGVIASADGMIHVFDIANLETIRNFQVNKYAITSMVTSEKTPQIAVYDKSETLSIWNFENGLKNTSAAVKEKPLTTLVYSNHDDFIIAGHLSGNLTFYNTATTQPLSSITVHTQPIINIHKLDKNQLLIVFRDGHLSLIDFSILNSLYTPINLLKTEVTFPDPSDLWGKYVNTLYRFIHRFDILIDDLQSIQVGDYDIQIE